MNDKRLRAVDKNAKWTVVMGVAMASCQIITGNKFEQNWQANYRTRVLTRRRQLAALSQTGSVISTDNSHPVDD